MTLVKGDAVVTEPAPATVATPTHATVRDTGVIVAQSPIAQTIQCMLVVVEGATATLPEAIVAGGISGIVSGIANFDLNSFFHLEKPTLENLEKDVIIGGITGVLGGAAGHLLGGVKMESWNPGKLGSELRGSSEEAVGAVSKGVNAFSKYVGDTGTTTIRVSNHVTAVVIGGSVELGKAATTGVVDPVLHFFFGG